jgi:hypothetical protein
LWPSGAVFATPETPDHEVLGQLFIAVNVFGTVVVTLIRLRPMTICKYRRVIASPYGGAKGVMCVTGEWQDEQGNVVC